MDCRHGKALSRFGQTRVDMINQRFVWPSFVPNNNVHADTYGIDSILNTQLHVEGVNS